MTDGEEILAGPVGREMKPEATDAANDATGDFEQVDAVPVFEHGAPDEHDHEDRKRELQALQQARAMELQPEGVGAEAMTAEAIRVDVELELLDQFSDAPGRQPRHEIGGPPHDS